MGVAGRSKVRASCWRRWVGARRGAVGSAAWVASQWSRLLWAMAASSGLSSMPTTLRKGSSLATSMARPLPAPKSMKV